MGAFQDVVVGRQHESLVQDAEGLRLVHAEELEKHLRVGDLEVVVGVLHFTLVVDVAVFHVVHPLEVVDVLHLLDEHGDAFDAVGDLGRHEVHVDAPHLLEVGELGDLHAVEPDFPAQSPGAHRGGFPVVLDEADVVGGRFYAQGGEALEVEVDDVGRRRLDDDLVLVVVLQAVGVLAVPAVGGPPGRLHVAHPPRLGSEDPEARGGVHGACAHLYVIGLLDDASLLRPEPFEPKDDFLEIHA
ncbi:hypothetical protein SDC9_72608 [bioreactor metagenome]|uniref:Uncharacterized protein n=1 Tax=bioreactor metagenome TaxID=1076179 RepID=A0A644YD22_9ZZZZ